MPKKLNATEFWTLVGVQTLAATLNAQLEVLVRAVASITGEELDEVGYGLATDFIYGPDSADPTQAVRSILRALDVKFETEFPKGESGG